MNRNKRKRQKARERAMRRKERKQERQEERQLKRDERKQARKEERRNERQEQRQMKRQERKEERRAARTEAKVTGGSSEVGKPGGLYSAASFNAPIPGMDQSDAPERIITESAADRRGKSYDYDRSSLKMDRDAYQFGNVKGFRD